ncbi:MAG: aromatic amino acid transport family protein [Patescibacteria group bacterium]
MESKDFFLSSSLLLGTMIGAGIFGLPFVVVKSGLLPAIFYFLILGIVSTLIHLFFGEIILRTKENCRLPGYAKKYLGNNGKIITSFSVLLGTVLALLAYIILGGNFLRLLFFPSINLSYFQFSLIFSFILLPFFLKEARLVAKAELFTNTAFILIVFAIFILSFSNIEVYNFVLFNPGQVFLPYGVILFALTGWSAIPEMTEILKGKERKKLKKSIIFSMIVSIVVYFIFVLAVMGVSGKYTSPDTFLGLIPFLNKNIILLGVLAGFITIADSFLILGLYLKNTLIHDYNFKRKTALWFSWGVPLTMFLLGFREFIGVIGFAGTMIGAIEGIIIVSIFKKAKVLGDREPEYSLNVPNFVTNALLMVFLIGAIFHFFS